MSELAYNLVGALQPGDVIEFGDVTELPAFEDMVALAVEPQPTPPELQAWAGRKAIRDLIRPPKFNGRITDVRLQVMADPYENLTSAKNRGWNMGIGGGSFALTGEYAERIIPRYRGFRLTADAKSSGRGTIGQIQTELWYYPVSPHMQLHTLILKSGISATYREIQRTTDSAGGTAVRRQVAKPKIEVDKFIALDETSRKIGFEVLRQAMRHPITQPMHQ